MPDPTAEAEGFKTIIHREPLRSQPAQRTNTPKAAGVSGKFLPAGEAVVREEAKRLQEQLARSSPNTEGPQQGPTVLRGLAELHGSQLVAGRQA